MNEAELSQVIDAAGGRDGPLRWRGIHLHVGSQLGAVDAWRDAVRRALALLGLLRGGLPDFDTLDVGGGFPVRPLDEPAPRPARFGRELAPLLEAIPPDRRPTRLAIEPGRFLVARAGWIVASVLHVRGGRARTTSGPPEGLAAAAGGPTRWPGEEPPLDRLVVIDAGMTELIRPSLYGALHPILALTSLGRMRGDPLDRLHPARVEGPICESTDSLGVHDLPPMGRGDLVAIRDTGAYGASISSTYNGRPRPPQILLETDGRLRLVRRRGSLASLG
jgi:diaminopimelate decarboxylase